MAVVIGGGLERAVRVSLGAAGAAMAIAAGGGRLPFTGSWTQLGPGQRDVVALGAALLLLAVLPAPARWLAAALQRARTAGPPPDRVVRRPHAWLLAAIVVLALGFRMAIVTTYWPSNHLAMSMSLWDAEMARNLIAGRGWVLNWSFVERVDRAVADREVMVDLQDFLPADDDAPGALQPFDRYAHTPGYAVWLAASFLAGGEYRFIYSQYFQAGLDALACLLVFGIGRRLWSPAAGLTGAAFYALSPAHAFLASQTVAAATDSFWVVAVSYGIVRTWTDLAAGRDGWVGTAVVALAAAAGTAMNSTAFLLPLVAAAAAGVLAVALRAGWRMTGRMLVAQAVVVLLLLPWGFRNASVYGRFTFLRQTTWQLVWETLGELPNPWGLGMGPNDIIYFSWVARHCPAPCTPVAREAVTREFLLGTVFPSADFPGHLARLVRHRLPGLVYVARLPVDRPFEADGPFGWLMSRTVAALNLGAIFLFPAAIAGLAVLVASPTTRAPAMLGLAPSAFVLLFSLLFFVEHRKTTPAYGYLLALSGVAVAAPLHSHAARR